ncbi:MAG: hypothetical protein EOP84_09830 [Verrucomicrobiaceae bacterium]|nr:MAG: hypothetical protein EOP84_09830 [Verrucomicrobiaceae bacterium]
MSTPDPDDVPNSEAFKNALLAIRSDITPAQHKMLKAHCLAAEHRITATQLATAAGFANFNAANLQYGFLGKALGEQLSFTPTLRNNGEPVWTSVLATGERPSDTGASEHYVWTMRPQVVEALLSLPWGIKARSHETGNG